MKQYRKKPVVIEAIQWDGTFTDALRIRKLYPDLVQLEISYKGDHVERWKIGTPEGSHEVSKGDFIIKGVKGEFYPCKPDIFAMTYEKVATPGVEKSLGRCCYGGLKKKSDYASCAAWKPEPTTQQSKVEVHPDDEAVDRMAARMKEKLVTARLKGRSGWMLKDEWPEAEVNISLYAHLAKGDPVDVANYCMFLAERRERTYGITGLSEPEIQARIDKAVQEEREELKRQVEELQESMAKVRREIPLEIQALQATVAMLREALEDIKEIPSNKFVWKGSFESAEGVRRAFAEIEPILEDALSASPNDWLKQHDEEVARKAKIEVLEWCKTNASDDRHYAYQLAQDKINELKETK